MTRPVSPFHRGTPFGLPSDPTIVRSTAREPAEPERSMWADNRARPLDFPGVPYQTALARAHRGMTGRYAAMLTAWQVRAFRDSATGMTARFAAVLGVGRGSERAISSFGRG